MSRAPLHLPAVLRSLLARRSARWALGLASAVVAYALLGYLLLPRLLEAGLRQQAEAIGLQVERLGRVAVDPFALTLAIDDLALTTPDGADRLGWQALQVDAGWQTIRNLAWTVDDFRVNAPFVHLRRQADGRIDLIERLVAWQARDTSPPGPTPAFILGGLQVVAGDFSFDDRVRSRQHHLRELQLSLPRLGSVPELRDAAVDLDLTGEFDGAQLAIAGPVHLLGAAPAGDLALRLDGLALPPWQSDLPAPLAIKLAAGSLTSALQLRFGPDLPSPKVQGLLEINGLRLSTRDDQPLLGWQRLAVDIAPSTPLAQQLAIRQVALNGLAAHLTVDRQGLGNWTQLWNDGAGKPAPPKPAGEAAARSAAPAQAQASKPTPTPWRWSVAALTLDGGTVHWRDASRPAEVQGALRDLQLRIGGLDSRGEQPLRIESAAAKLDFGRQLQVDRVQLAGIALDLKNQQIAIDAFEQQGVRLQGQRLAGGGTRWLTPPRLAEKPLTAASTASAASTVATSSADGGTAATGGDAAALGEGKGDAGQLPVADGRATRPTTAGTPSSAPAWQIRLARWQVGDLRIGLDAPKLAVDPAASEEILRWRSLRISGIAASTGPQGLAIERIALNDFAGRLLLDAQGQLNATALAAAPGDEAPANPPAGAAATKRPTAATVAANPSNTSNTSNSRPAAPALPIRIGEILLAGGQVDFTDQFIQPNYAVTVSELGGAVRGLSSAAGTLADLDLRGRYGEHAPVQIKAHFNPLLARPALDLKASISAVDLTALSAYAGKYAGYGIRQGVLSMDVSYQLQDGRLNADNHLFIDQLTFGDAVDSPQATSLPVQFAVALLKNSRGEIDLNLPISGALDDPQFSVSGLVFKVLGNVLAKAVTSPFALLGSLFGGGEDLSEVRFAPGSATIDGAALLRLQGLARAMKERPALHLDLQGQADPQRDTPALPVVLAAAKSAAANQPALLPTVTVGKGGEPAARSAAATLSTAPVVTPSLPNAALASSSARTAAVMPGATPAGTPAGSAAAGVSTGAPAGAAPSPADIVRELQQLAERRAETVRHWLQVHGQIDAARLHRLPSDQKSLENNGDKNGEVASRVRFSLR